MHSYRVRDAKSQQKKFSCLDQFCQKISRRKQFMLRPSKVLLIRDHNQRISRHLAESKFIHMLRDLDELTQQQQCFSPKQVGIREKKHMPQLTKATTNDKLSEEHNSEQYMNP